MSRLLRNIFPYLSGKKGCSGECACPLVPWRELFVVLRFQCAYMYVCVSLPRALCASSHTHVSQRRSWQHQQKCFQTRKSPPKKSSCQQPNTRWKSAGLTLWKIKANCVCSDTLGQESSRWLPRGRSSHKAAADFLSPKLRHRDVGHVF